MPACADSQCLTPTPEPGGATSSPKPSATPPVLSPVAASSPAAGGATADEVPAGDQLAFQSESAGLGPVEWAAEIDPETHEPRQRVESFPTDAPVIYAVVAVDHIAAGTTLQATWTYNRTPLETLDQSMVVDTASSNTWLEFHLALTQPGTWPAGEYELSILVNGEPAVSGSVRVASGP